MGACDTWTSWQKGRGKGKTKRRRDWVVEDVLLPMPVVSSVFILIWRWDLIDGSEQMLVG